MNLFQPIDNFLHYFDRVVQNQYHEILKIEKDNPKSEFN